jgi:hypothetical protein
MPKKLHKLTVADIVRQLPLHQQLDASQAALIKLTPVWLKWAQSMLLHDSAHNHLTAEQLEVRHVELSSVHEGKLVLSCSSATMASLIRHQTQNLLDYLHKQGFIEIEQVIVRLHHPIQRPPNQEPNSNTDENNLHPLFTRASENSFKAIENCQKMVKNDQLATSLEKLVRTLKEFDAK